MCLLCIVRALRACVVRGVLCCAYVCVCLFFFNFLFECVCVCVAYCESDAVNARLASVVGVRVLYECVPEQGIDATSIKNGIK